MPYCLLRFQMTALGLSQALMIEPLAREIGRCEYTISRLLSWLLLHFQGTKAQSYQLRVRSMATALSPDPMTKPFGYGTDILAMRLYHLSLGITGQSGLLHCSIHPMARALSPLALMTGLYDYG
ncbi:hypothetical protein RSOL_407610 [Rhizoctonia solani AG-3 Rhs1AP]|uniref:Uncharacterized protein n=1 Tax=Rhizoctonia solani AG-3 Rhs1AP TaxID=1086054 RepID=X8JDL2_9AGAM|nr:hypothetical protein RSOL_407610 [Rhizoctonia solani AG-3 Rhs1AP]